MKICLQCVSPLSGGAGAMPSWVADLTAGTKVAAFALLKFVNRKDGRAFACEETIAKACGMTERGVRAAIAALKAAGFVRVVRRGKMQSNLVYLALPMTGIDKQVIGMDAQSDRHDHDKVTGMAMPPNLRIEPLTEPLRDNLPERPTSELSVEDASKKSFDGKEEKKDLDRSQDSIDLPLPRVSDEHVAYVRISRAAINLMGWDTGSCPKMPDGRYADQAIWGAICSSVGIGSPASSTMAGSA